MIQDCMTWFSPALPIQAIEASLCFFLILSSTCLGSNPHKSLAGNT